MCGSCSHQGKKLSKKHKLNIGKASKKAMNNPKLRERISKTMTGVKRGPLTKEHINKVRQSMKKIYADPKFRKKMSLAKGGTGIPYENSTYPDEFHKIRHLVLERDNNKCQMSDITNKEHIKKFGKQLTVHHIDYNKQNNNERNLIVLSFKWNIKVNTNRKYWTKFFKELV